MEFFTKVDIPCSPSRLDFSKGFAFFGSCFADNISRQFSLRKFQVLANPFGTLYNPISIGNAVKAIATGRVYGAADVFQDAQGRWHCWEAHSSLSGATREECIANLNGAVVAAQEFLKRASTVFVTLGTAFVYYLKKDGTAVSNCHRQDPGLFERRLISVEAAARALEGIVRDLKTLNGKVQVVFTVSPLRHLSDGAHGNSLSKATLQLAVEKMLEIASPSVRNDEKAEGMVRNDEKAESSGNACIPIAEANQSCALRNDEIGYFPSYEIVMDELRDYRFYDSDMVHLSRTAEEYIFQRMVETYCDAQTQENIRKVEKFLKGANHRIQDENSPATREFRKKLAAQAKSLESEIPGLNLGI